MLTSKILIVFLTAFELISGQPHRELIPNIVAPQQIIWRDMEHVIFVKDEDILEFNSIEKTLTNIESRQPNEFVGLDENENIVICGIQHFIIDSEDEFSTIFTINGKELKFFPTIRPISLKGDTIIAMTALDFLEQNYYEISISSGEMKKIEEPNYTEIKALYIEEDLQGNVYLNYNVRDILRIFLQRQKL